MIIAWKCTERCVLFFLKVGQYHSAVPYFQPSNIPHLPNENKIQMAQPTSPNIDCPFKPLHLINASVVKPIKIGGVSLWSQASLPNMLIPNSYHIIHAKMTGHKTPSPFIKSGISWGSLWVIISFFRSLIPGRREVTLISSEAPVYEEWLQHLGYTAGSETEGT